APDQGVPSISEDHAAPAEVAEDLLEQPFLVLVGGWRGTADEVENLAVLDPVLGNALDHARTREVDRNNPPVHLLRGQEGHLLGRAGDVIEGVARSNGACRRRRAQHHPDLLLGHARLDLLQLGWLEVVTVLRNNRAGTACCNEPRKHHSARETGGATCRLMHPPWYQGNRLAMFASRHPRRRQFLLWESVCDSACPRLSGGTARCNVERRVMQRGHFRSQTDETPSCSLG